MSFTITCNKCGATADSIKETGESMYNEIMTDEKKEVVLRSEAGYHGTSSISILCKCGNEE